MHQHAYQRTYVIKYGGNAMICPDLKRAVLKQISTLCQESVRVVLVHGGGPFIQEALDQAGVESEFIGGHRKTTRTALGHVEKTLKGQVNPDLVKTLNQLGCPAIGLSGYDGIVKAVKRTHKTQHQGQILEHDLGQVGDVAQVNPALLLTLLDEGYTPVLTCLATDAQGQSYNINADIFAGHIAGALKADEYIVLTDVDGLRENPADPQSLVSHLDVTQIPHWIQSGKIQGGMLPKIESCQVALNTGAKNARILNGTQPEQLQALLQNQPIGTQIQCQTPLQNPLKPHTPTPISMR